MSGPVPGSIEALLGVEFEFRRQPDPIAASLRPKRRVPLLLLLLAKSRGKKLSWKGIHLLNWAVRSAQNMDLVLRIGDGIDIPELPIVRIEPAMDRAIDLAVGLGFVEGSKGRAFKLTPLGESASVDVAESGAFATEREQLARLRGKFTQSHVDRLLEWRLR